MTFDVRAGLPRDGLREVMRRFHDGGGRVVDTSPLYGNAEVNVGELSSGLGLNDTFFFTDKVWVTGDYLSDTSHGLRSIDQSMGASGATWSQFFLKWAISHPAVTCALPATTNPDHMSENLGAMRGPMPDAAMRDRMYQYMRSVPGFDQLDRMPWYPGKTFQGLVHLGA